MELIHKHFPNLSPTQIAQFEALGPLYAEWNEMINVISRKDIEGLYTKHVLHSLSIAKLFDFPAGYKILDIGTGGGFPGIPLAIIFPEVHFTLSDSIAKKIKVVNAIAENLGLVNVTAIAQRGENIHDYFDVVVARAVTRLLPLQQWASTRLNSIDNSVSDFPLGLIALKGGDLSEEIDEFLAENPESIVDEYALSTIFEDPFFETKKILHVHS
jgi:16S rRNA (guanine527-N7)-methyltransferase